jgi:predicted DsbA family dithiol-disulfide isomerase
MPNNNDVVVINSFSDILCVWAYVAQIRVDELHQKRGGVVDLKFHFMPMFGSTASKIDQNWQSRGGRKAYAEHVIAVGQRFDHLEIHPDVWMKNVPPSSASCHHLLKAVELLVEKGLLPAGPQDELSGRYVVEEMAWRLRLAFFRDVRDISQRKCQFEIAEELKIPTEALADVLDSGEAMAALFDDFALKETYKVYGSPTFVFNEGRQILFGNVGYRAIDATVEELLHHADEGDDDAPLWC